MKSRIPSPRQLKLARFNRPDFRATTKRGKRAAGWTWSRAVYRLRRWFNQFNADWNNVLERDIVEPMRTLVRAIMALKNSRARPDLVSRETSRARAEMRMIAREERATVIRQMTRSNLRDPHPARGVVETGAARQSAPSRLSARLKGAAHRPGKVAKHRLENVDRLPHKAFLIAMDARNKYVTANLLRLKGLATTRAFGEPSWREARRADRSEFAAA